MDTVLIILLSVIISLLIVIVFSTIVFFVEKFKERKGGIGSRNLTKNIDSSSTTSPEINNFKHKEHKKEKKSFFDLSLFGLDLTPKKKTTKKMKTSSKKSSFFSFDFSLFSKKKTPTNDIKEPEVHEPTKEQIEIAPDIKPQNIRATTNKDRTVIVYNNVGVPSVTILDYKEGKLVDTFEIDLAGFTIENGVVSNIYGLADRIKEKALNIDTIDVLLNVNECFRNVVALPKISNSKSKKLYEEALYNDFPDYEDRFVTFRTTYKHHLGIVYHTYFIPLNFIDYSKKLATLLNAKLGNLDIFGEFLFNNINDVFDDDYSLIYIRKNIVNFITSMDGSLVSLASFSFSHDEDIVSKYLSIVSKHEFELEKRLIRNVIIVSDEEHDLSTLTNKLHEIKYDLDLSYYNVTGIRL